MSQPRIIIGALTGQNMSERRERCRKTWMADAATLGVQVMFLFGDGRSAGPSTLRGDELHTPTPDAYQTLPQRTRAWCEWALQRDDWDYLFKGDDDTYVAVGRLLAYDLADRDYIGGEWRPGINYASGGAGYFLSRKAVSVVAEKMTCPTGAEDMIVGRRLRESGIKFHVDNRFIAYGKQGERIVRPAKDNNLITTHAIGADVFLAAHAEVGLQAATATPSAVSPGFPPPDTASAPGT